MVPRLLRIAVTTAILGTLLALAVAYAETVPVSLYMNSPISSSAPGVM